MSHAELIIYLFFGVPVVLLLWTYIFLGLAILSAGVEGFIARLKQRKQ